MDRLTIVGFKFDSNYVAAHLQSWPIAQALNRLAAYEDTGLMPDEINALHERLNAEDAKVGKWPVFVSGSAFHGANIVGADYGHKTVTLDWSENGGAE